MIMGLTHGRFMDDKTFRPIFERAVALDVPVYIHPTPPHPAVGGAYFKEYPALAVAPLGFMLETLTIIASISGSPPAVRFPMRR